jgi:RNA polymerase sigma-70 factor (sigma-B/F/G subfamily)
VVSDGEVDVVEVRGVLDLATAPRLRTVLMGCLAGGGAHIVIDLSGVELIDCTAVGTFVRMRAHAERGGGSLRAVGARGLVLEVLEITGVAKSLGGYDEPLAQDPTARDPTGAEPGEDDVSERDPGDDPAGLLLRMMAQLPPHAPERQHLRQEVIEYCLPYATALARRYRDRGEPMEDLAQVATVGLVKAIDGYDPAHGAEFTAFATPTILGEIRRHFRDKGWRIRVPRRLQELRLHMHRAESEITQRLGRAPNAADYAEYLGVGEMEVLEAMEAGRGYSPASLSAPLAPGSEATLGDPIGGLDPGLEAVESREALRDLVGLLPRREQRILTLRFFGNKTQAQIAQEIGVSQMHVSRLLAHALAQLRAALLSE